MTFSIVTPSWRSSDWLRLCVASVEDQDVAHEHLVQDSCSDDGTLDWLPGDRRVTAFVEKDQGMYDAVNRGLCRARGDLAAYLNCDEQYLPGALRMVSEFFERHREVDVVFGDCLVVGPMGEYICERRALVPRRLHSLVSGNLSVLTAATFFRRRVLEERQLWFNANYRDLGDAEWVVRLIESGVRMAVLGRFTSTFTETGHNMNLSANAARERRAFRRTAPAWAQAAAPLIIARHRLRRWRAGHYQAQKLSYAIYTRARPDVRTAFEVTEPTAIWRGRIALPRAN